MRQPRASNYRSLIALLSIGLGVTGCASQEGSMEEGYPIHLDRPSQVGEKMQHERKWASRFTPYAGQSGTATLRYTSEVLVVDANGAPTRTAITIQEFTSSVPDEKVGSIGPGTKLALIQTFAPDAPPTAELIGPNDRALPKTALLTTMICGHEDSRQDELFGTPEHMRPGDVWPVNTKFYMARHHIDDNSPWNISGESKLVEVKSIDGVQCAVVQIHVKESHRDVHIENLIDTTWTVNAPLKATLGSKGRTQAFHAVTVTGPFKDAQGTDSWHRLEERLDSQDTPITATK